MNHMLVLGIETSCDDTAGAVVADGSRIRSSIVTSQVDLHRKFGGIVPELAARSHIEAIVPVIQTALSEAGVSWSDIGLVAVTRGPGLIGSLLVGLSIGKALAYALRVPLMGVNHLVGHWSAAFLDRPDLTFPFVALVVSGGHTSLFFARAINQITMLGQTLDDAAGEALDKAAKLLGLGYPGGAIIDELSRRGDPHAIAFPRALRTGLDFSFSGMKTSLFMYLKKRGPVTFAEVPHIAASFLEAIVDVLCEKTLQAAREMDVHQVVVCGGVAANSRLRSRFEQDGEKEGINVYLPPLNLCTDNAAMIAAAGYRLFRAGQRDDLRLNAESRVEGR